MDQAKALLAQAENATHLQDWQLGLVALAIVIVLGIIIAAIRGKMRRARERREDEDAAAYYAAQERADQERAEQERAERERAAAEAAAASEAAAAAAAAVPQAVTPAAPGPEPVAPAAPVSEPVAPPPPPAPVAASERKDDLTTMKGVGPRLEEKLNSLGINSFAQIAALSPAEAADLDSKLGDFTGRLERDHWIEQAQLLAAADRATYEAKFGKL